MATLSLSTTATSTGFVSCSVDGERIQTNLLYNWSPKTKLWTGFFDLNGLTSRFVPFFIYYLFLEYNYEIYPKHTI